MPRLYGEIETTPLEGIDALVTAGHEQVWRPSEQIQSEVPENFTLTIRSTTDQSGIHRFRPIDWQSFVPLAGCGGLAIRKVSEASVTERLFSDRISLLIYQFHGRMRSSLARVFTREKDLYCSPAASDDSIGHIIPRHLWPTDSQADSSPPPSDVIAASRRIANERGVRAPDEATLIQLALDDGARRRPIPVEDFTTKQLRTTVRLGLFDLGPSPDPIPEEVRNEVIARFCESVEKHAKSSRDEFHRWFFDALDNIIKQISERKRTLGSIDRQGVRRVILEQVFESYVHLAVLVEAQMGAFAEALPEPLRNVEFRIYRAMYFRQPWLGGLSICLLIDHFPLLKTLLAEFLGDPESQESNATKSRSAAPPD